MGGKPCGMKCVEVTSEFPGLYSGLVPTVLKDASYSGTRLFAAVKVCFIYLLFIRPISARLHPLQADNIVAVGVLAGEQSRPVCLRSSWLLYVQASSCVCVL